MMRTTAIASPASRTVRPAASRAFGPGSHIEAPPRPRTDEPSLGELARRAGYRLETASLAGHWLLIDPDGELARTPRGDRAWTAAEARRRLDAVTPRG